jgi:hypothetical protein
MEADKFIYWRKEGGKEFANVHLLVGYNSCSIADFQAMAAELRETFPQAKDGEIKCGRINKSSMYDGHSIITWTAEIPVRDYAGWVQKPIGQNPEYNW